MDAFIVKGFYTIAGLKTNRVIYPNGIRQQINDFAKHLRKTDTAVHKVTVGKRNYWIYRYNGKLNGTDSASAIPSYPEKAFGKPEALRAFICTNEALSEQEILNLYTQRWPIEIFFRETKGKLALDKYQIRSATGVRRFWLMMSLVHFVCCVGRGMFCAFADGFRFWQKTLTTELISYIYACGESGKPIPCLR